MNTFTRSVELLHRAMDVNSLRYQVSANNIANSEVPNYKRQTVNFESELKRAFESEADKAHKFELTRTDSRHFALEEPYDWKTVEPRRVTDWTTTADANGNNVDAEYEATVVLKTQMNYRLLAQLQNFEFSQVKLAMRKWFFLAFGLRRKLFYQLQFLTLLRNCVKRSNWKLKFPH